MSKSKLEKGIILAGGTGSRLSPITRAISKQLLPIYNKPMIYYPLTTLMLADIREITVIVNSNEEESFKKLLRDGNQWGINIKYKLQEKPNGIAEAFLIADKFIDNNPVCLILGDNLFFGSDLQSKLIKHSINNNGATVFTQSVNEPKRYGIVEFGKDFKAINIEEKPKKPKSNYAITGLYFFDNKVVEYAKRLKPSSRNELEITDLLKIYLKKKKLTSDILGRGGAWLDTGSIEDFYKTSAFVSAIENRQGFKIACLEEIAFNNKWIGKKEILEAIQFYGRCDYTNYLKKLIS